MNSPKTTLSEHRCFGGTVGIYKHAAASTRCDMRLAVFTPPQTVAGTKPPALIFLSGLTCTEENATVKAGMFRVAAALGLMIVVPDTSPRGADVEAGESGSFGFGAGFYLDATQAPWSTHYRMESYITRDLHELITGHFNADNGRIGLFGHSMGGHGALTLFQKHPGQYQSLSAFAPICAPSQSVWGTKAFETYLGADPATWKAHDACQLLLSRGPVSTPILIDQGMNDPFLDRLSPDAFETAAASVGQQLTLRRQAGYDHGYFFIQTFVEDHLRHHAALL